MRPFIFIAAGGEKKKERERGGGNLHLPSARLVEKVAIATTWHAPSHWQVKTSYLPNVKVAAGMKKGDM